MYLDSFPFAEFFELFTGVGYVRDYNVALFLVLLNGLLVVLVLLLDCWWDWVNLRCQWLRAQGGKWQCWRAVLMWSSSLSMLSWDEETVLALCAKVLKTLCFAVMWWLLSQWRYIFPFSFPYGKYTHVPPLLIYNKSYTSAILVSFLHFIC